MAEELTLTTPITTPATTTVTYKVVRLYLDQEGQTFLLVVRGTRRRRGSRGLYHRHSRLDTAPVTPSTLSADRFQHYGSYGS
jgi:hypothetical protein